MTNKTGNGAQCFPHVVSWRSKDCIHFVGADVPPCTGRPPCDRWSPWAPSVGFFIPFGIRIVRNQRHTPGQRALREWCFPPGLVLLHIVPGFPRCCGAILTRMPVQMPLAFWSHFTSNFVNYAVGCYNVATHITDRTK